MQQLVGHVLGVHRHHCLQVWKWIKPSVPLCAVQRLALLEWRWRVTGSGRFQSLFDDGYRTRSRQLVGCHGTG